MFKQLFLVVVLFTVLNMTLAKEIVLGTDGTNKITMTYVKRTNPEENLRVRFHMVKETPLGYDRAAAAICCTEAINYPTATPTTNESTEATENTANNGGRNLQEEPTTEEPTTEEPTTEEPTTEEPTTEEPTTEEPTTEEPTTEEPTTEEPTEEEPSKPFKPEDNVGKCFGMRFTCTVPGGCGGSSELGLVMYQSTVVNKVWQAASNDYSSLNVGAVIQGTGSDFETRYSMSNAEAQKSAIPLIGTDYTTQLGCYTAYDIPASEVFLNSNIDLSSGSWAYKQNLDIEVTEEELTEETVPESGAFSQFLSFSVLGALVTFFTIL